MSASTRRAALGAILAAPLASVAVVAKPTDLTAACHRAACIEELIGTGSFTRGMSDEQVEVLYDEAVALTDCAIAGTARTIEEVVAKARLALAIWRAQHPEPESEMFSDERLVMTALRDAAALGA